MLKVTPFSEIIIPADLRFTWANVYGHTYNLRVFWDDLFTTDEPDHIKVGLNYQGCCAFWNANAIVDICITNS